MHVHAGEGPDRKVSNPIIELIVTRRDEASLLAVEGMSDGKCHTASITMVQQVRWIDAIAQKEGIPPLLRP